MRLAIGTGTDGYDVTPERADALADEFRESARSARDARVASGASPEVA
ncbi:hypothetical protein [Mycolicibacterium arseniciresistens]|uniref:Uncharacterized protein n=1 Tax=Mycolicibacterium arseniciresistens TaxID=3062257 RepID=A0ABT8UFP6_9MYCO|nr:hypothetical protein [Mycolicibacterium arseniciresistens]MDO3636011.1 hypothetical protein [Mycolicibacterium arseniciresistens]